MKKTSIYISMLIAVITLLSACYKDIGNYDYRPIDLISIKTDTNAYTILTTDTLRIKPVITAEDKNEQNYRYSWQMARIVDSGTPDTIRNISDQKNLQFVPSAKHVPGNYQLALKVTNTSTEVSTYQNFRIRIVSPFTEGMLILTEKNNNSEINVISPTDKVYYNQYEYTNKKKLVGKPVSIHCSTLYNDQRLAIFTTDNVAMLFKDNLADLGDLSAIFWAVPAVRQPQLLRPSNGMDEYMMNNGQLYHRNVMTPENAPRYGTAYNRAFRLSPFLIGSYPYPAILFDETNGRFVYFDSYDKEVRPFGTDDDSLAVFDMNQLKGEDLKHFSYGAESIAYAVMKNKTTPVFTLLGIYPDYEDKKSARANRKQEMKNCPDLATAVSFAYSRRLPQVYYATQKKIFLYDIAANRAREIYAITGSENIALIKTLRKDANDVSGANDNVLYVATSDAAGGGKFYQFTMLPTGDFENNTFTKAYTGFDRIIDFTYKPAK